MIPVWPGSVHRVLHKRGLQIDSNCHSPVVLNLTFSAFDFEIGPCIHLGKRRTKECPIVFYYENKSAQIRLLRATPPPGNIFLLD